MKQEEESNSSPFQFLGTEHASFWELSTYHRKPDCSLCPNDIINKINEAKFVEFNRSIKTSKRNQERNQNLGIPHNILHRHRFSPRLSLVSSHSTFPPLKYTTTPAPSRSKLQTLEFLRIEEDGFGRALSLFSVIFIRKRCVLLFIYY